MKSYFSARRIIVVLCCLGIGVWAGGGGCAISSHEEHKFSVETATQKLTSSSVDYGPDVESLLSLSSTASINNPAVPLTVLFSYTGKVRLIYGDVFRISLADIGCPTNTSEEHKGMCFLSQTGDAFGVSDPANDLVYEGTYDLPDGSKLVRYRQYYQGVPVFYARFSLILTSTDEVIQVYSTFIDNLSLPAPDTNLTQSHQFFDEVVATNNAEAQLKSSVQLEELTYGVYVDTKAKSTTALPAVWGLAVYPDVVWRKSLFVFSAPDGTPLHHRNAGEFTADRYLRTTGRPFYPGDDNCQDEYDCPNPNVYICSDHYDPKRCVGNCLDDYDCSFLDYKCMDSNGNLDGYCYMHPEDSPPGSEIELWNSISGWTWTPYYSEHKVFSKVRVSLDAIVDYHYVDLGMNGWDENDGDYITYLESVCGCEAGTSCKEYEGCPSGHQCGTAVCLNQWMDYWLPDSNAYYAWWREVVHGHEWRHFVGTGHNQGFADPDTCLHEGICDMDGFLFAAKRNGENHMHEICGKMTNSYNDDRNGLNGSCGLDRMPYAYRSRFDWLECGAQYWGSTCTDDDDCDPYELCELEDPDDPYSGRCTNSPWPYHGRHLWGRLLRIVSQGAGAFTDEEIDIPHDPVGWDTTAKIFQQANLQVTGSTDLRDYLDLLISSAYQYGESSAMIHALGATGFFPRKSQLASYGTDRGPIKIMFNGWAGSSNKEFVFWRQPSTGRIKYQYYEGSTPKFFTFGIINTDARPAVVEWGNYLHLYYRDAVSGVIKLCLIHTSGSWYGPFEQRSEFTPVGAFDAAVFNDRLYLVFADNSNSDKLTVAWCDQSICYRPYHWHDFGGGVYKKVVSTDSKIGGVSAIAADRVNGISSSFCVSAYDYLFIAAADYPSGRLRIYRVGTDDNVDTVYSIPESYPSYRTDAPIGLTVQDSAFMQTCMFYNPVSRKWEKQDTPRRYLYLAWKEKDGDRVFASVLQNADHDAWWLTRSADALFKVRSNTGVSWPRGKEPGDQLQIIHTSKSIQTPFQYHGFGRY